MYNQLGFEMITYRALAPLVLASSANAPPTSVASSVFQVAANKTEAGKQAAVAPSLKLAPLAPFGPSDIYIPESAFYNS